MILYYNQVRSAKRDEIAQGPAKRDDYMLVQMIWVILILIWVLFMVQLLYFYCQMMKILANIWINHTHCFYIENSKTRLYYALGWISDILHCQNDIYIMYIMVVLPMSWILALKILAPKR
eukprot:509976_1